MHKLRGSYPYAFSSHSSLPGVGFSSSGSQLCHREALVPLLWQAGACHSAKPLHLSSAYNDTPISTCESGLTKAIDIPLYAVTAIVVWI